MNCWENWHQCTLQSSYQIETPCGVINLDLSFMCSSACTFGLSTMRILLGVLHIIWCSPNAVSLLLVAFVPQLAHYKIAINTQSQ